MNLRERFREAAARIDALSLRERALLMLGAFMVLFLLWDGLLMSDISRRSGAVNAEMDTIRTRVDQLNAAIAAASQTRGRDPNVALQAELEETRASIAELDEALAARSGQVISPREMARVLEEILRRQGRLKLISAESLPPRPLFEHADEAGLPGTVFRHGLAFEVEGRYLDVLAYLRELENLEWQFFWETVVLESERYPTNRVQIRIYSLNLEEGWLGV